MRKRNWRSKENGVQNFYYDWLLKSWQKKFETGVEKGKKFKSVCYLTKLKKKNWTSNENNVQRRTWGPFKMWRNYEQGNTCRKRVDGIWKSGMQIEVQTHTHTHTAKHKYFNDFSFLWSTSEFTPKPFVFVVVQIVFRFLLPPTAYSWFPEFGWIRERKWNSNHCILSIVGLSAKRYERWRGACG